ncbi:hypothetical protein PPL_07780 [Heterostelium album PN500]|uniref:Uncharacterized protein n=1 Tax=Heterostelium pallidum (strain ATCC 26659 / Pp 5 / PN500) TaxID=670386 RepID=D3BGX8_HETP5|nr:hypothetical protein PPL_07780 [Heterostelium album PN500]EFA79362.1 hypothetical protein PPL_07780 [Heterostelium album PN500]|eukprot:XP_020431483.1 hypothetical protein PPL_07780 [Heterostelium album PN500]
MTSHYQTLSEIGCGCQLLREDRTLENLPWSVESIVISDVIELRRCDHSSFIAIYMNDHTKGGFIHSNQQLNDNFKSDNNKLYNLLFLSNLSNSGYLFHLPPQ